MEGEAEGEEGDADWRESKMSAICACVSGRKMGGAGGGRRGGVVAHGNERGSAINFFPFHPEGRG